VVVVGFEGENSARFMGEGCFIGLAGFRGDLPTSTLRTGDLTGEQRRSSSWLTVTLLGEALGKRFALFGWIEGDLHGVRAFRAGLTGVLNGLASFEGEQKRFLGAGDLLCWAGDRLDLIGDLLGLSRRLAMSAAETFPGLLNKGPFLERAWGWGTVVRCWRGLLMESPASWEAGVNGGASPLFSFASTPLAGVLLCLLGDPPLGSVAPFLLPGLI